MSNPTRSKFAGLLVCIISLVGMSGVSVVAYELGSMFIFDVREGEEAALSGRILISPTVFAEDIEKPNPELATDSERSEFEVDFSALGTESGNSFKSDFDVGGFGSGSSSGESSFGSEASQSTGFDFNY